jgi:hypothetical protein
MRTDGGVSNEQAKALMMGVWDDKNSECLRIDLWTKDMLMDDMKRMYPPDLYFNGRRI